MASHSANGLRGIVWGLVLVPLAVAVVAPHMLAPYTPEDLFPPYQSPTSGHILGTDAIGQDVLSLLIFSARTSLGVGFFSALLAITIGVLIGLVSGHCRGTPDELLMRVADIFMLLPRLPLIILIVAYLGPGTWEIILLIAVTAWPGAARVVRSRTLQIRETGFIRSAIGLGAGPFYVMIHHILPNIFEIIFAKGMLAAGSAMIAEAGLSFLGLGEPGYMSWGAMIHDALAGGALVNGCYWWLLPPVFCISASVVVLTVAGFTAERIAPLTVLRPAPRIHSRSDSGLFNKGEMLSVANLAVDFHDFQGTAHRVLDDVNFRLAKREKAVVIGHTGSGKSVLLLALLRLLPENGSLSGSICYRGNNILAFSEKRMRSLRGLELGYVPQGTGNAFNPLLTVGFQIAESARVHKKMGKAAAREKSISLLRMLALERPEERIREYPHRYSGGMLQRALLAAALMTEPRLLLVDEPTKGLDPEGREQMLGAFLQLAAQTILLVTHDLDFARRFADRVIVMHASRIVEIAPRDSFFRKPLHPYSKALLAAQPGRGMEIPKRNSFLNVQNSGGCSFRPWCDAAFDRCAQTPEINNSMGRAVRCWHYVV
jgi:peptide/nickel transport system permease protein